MPLQTSRLSSDYVTFYFPIASPVISVLEGEIVAAFLIVLFYSIRFKPVNSVCLFAYLFDRLDVFAFP